MEFLRKYLHREQCAGASREIVGRGMIGIQSRRHGIKEQYRGKGDLSGLFVEIDINGEFDADVAWY